jgi:hypothetical protein
MDLYKKKQQQTNKQTKNKKKTNKQKSRIQAMGVMCF